MSVAFALSGSLEASYAEDGSTREVSSYNEFYAAVTEGNDGDVIVLKADIEFPAGAAGAYAFPIEKSFTIRSDEGNKRSLDLKKNCTYLQVNNGKRCSFENVVIKNGEVEHAGWHAVTVQEKEDAWLITNHRVNEIGGREIVYTVTEDAVHGYSAHIDEKSFDIRNEYTPGKNRTTEKT